MLCSIFPVLGVILSTLHLFNINNSIIYIHCDKHCFIVEVLLARWLNCRARYE